MRYKTIFARMFMFFIIFTFILVGTLWIFQISFLPDYYENQKINMVNTFITDIDDLLDEGKFTAEYLEKLSSASEVLNGRIIVYDKQGKMLLYEGTQGMMRDTRISLDQINSALRGEKIVYTTNSVRGNTDFLAVLSSGKDYIYLFLTPFQAIEDAVSITQGFYLYLFVGGIILASILSWIFAKKISKPLVELNSIASNIANLKFENKWSSDRTDEIGQLGRALNILSENLEKSINELQEELCKEKNLDKMRKKFISRVSHELQTPIAIINGHMEALVDGIPQSEEEKNRYFRIIEAETTKMSYLIKELLDLSQLESGTFKVSKHQFNYIDLIERKMNNFHILFKEKEIIIEKEINSENIIIFADEYRIEQVLNNIIQNAINHTKEKGKIKISVTSNDGMVKTEIFNLGDNIPEENLPLVWEAFYKGKEKSGTGIGLAIVKNIVELHKGNYGVYNFDNGVVFFFEIPIK